MEIGFGNFHRVTFVDLQLNICDCHPICYKKPKTKVRTILAGVVDVDSIRAADVDAAGDERVADVDAAGDERVMVAEEEEEVEEEGGVEVEGEEEEEEKVKEAKERNLV